MAIILNGFGQRRALINGNPISRVEKRSVPLIRLVALFWTWRKRAAERGYLVPVSCASDENVEAYFGYGMD